MIYRLLFLFLLFTVPVQAGQPIDTKTEIIFSQATYPPGTYSLPSTILKAGISLFTLTIARNNWTNPAVTVAYNVDFSPDNGKTWINRYCAFTSRGSPFNPKNPNSVARCQCIIIAGCDPAGTSNRVRGSITIAGGSLTASGSLVIQ